MNRPALATVWVMFVLAAVSLISLGIARQFVLGRQAMDLHEHRVQALWLARSGMESAVDRVNTGGRDYSGETLTPIPDGEVKVTVEPVPDSSDRVRVTAVARYPTTGRHPAARSVTRELTVPAKK